MVFVRWYLLARCMQRDVWMQHGFGRVSVSTTSTRFLKSFRSAKRICGGKFTQRQRTPISLNAGESSEAHFVGSIPGRVGSFGRGIWLDPLQRGWIPFNKENADL